MEVSFVVKSKPISETQSGPKLVGARGDSRIIRRTTDPLRPFESGEDDSAVRRSFLQKKEGFQHRRNRRNVHQCMDVPFLLPSLTSVRLLETRRCTWITPNSVPAYISFHDEEWGVPVHDDRKLFEFLVLSEALAELNWPVILNKRDLFKKLFDNFNPSSVATFTETKILSLRSSGSILLSDQKLRAIMENARQMLKVAEEFGSFGCYCWGFVNHKPIANNYRYARQVPVRTPKAEAMSKDLMRRGFRCVGPTVIYSFMQAAGIVNDHLSSCFRYQDCIHSHANKCKTNAK